MALNKPEDFYKAGSKVFRRAPVNREAIAGWVTIAGTKARDALNGTVSAETRLDAAYDSIFNLSLAVLCANGWRCTAADGHHAQGLEAACAYAGVTQSMFDQIDAVRDLRNNKYDGIPASIDDVKLAIETVNKLAPMLMPLVQKHLQRD